MSNPYRVIKKLAFLTGCCIVAGMSVRAQQSYYIFIQSENAQPFYAQIGDKVYSSSAIGHLIISDLKDNNCNFEIGFPQHTIKPQQFAVQVRGKDHGYQLKKTGAQEWALYNWQNQESVKPLRGSGSSTLLYGERKKDDAFAALMAAVVNDSAVLYTSVMKTDAPDAPAIAKTEANKTVKQPVQPADSVKEDKKTDVAITGLTPVADTAKLYKNEKPLFDTSAVVASKNEKPVDTAASVSVTDKTAKPSYDTTESVAKVYRNDKPLYDTTSATAKPYKNEKPLYDTSKVIARIYKEDKPLFDTVITTVTPVYRNDRPLYDTTAAIAAKVAEEPVVKETWMAKKPGKTKVIKIQESINKDGETKLVFVDSSESPASVVTVYINEEKTPVQQKTPAQPVSADPLTAGALKTGSEPKPDTDKKEPANKADIVANTEPAPAKKDAVKEAGTAPVKQEGPEIVRTLQPVTEKPAVKKGDTLTIILESPQMRKDTARTVKQEAPKPLYEPKQSTQPVSVQNADIAQNDFTARKDTPVSAKNTDKATTTDKQESPVIAKTADKPTTTEKQDSPLIVKAADKPVTTENQPVVDQPVQKEPAKAAEKAVSSDTQARTDADTAKKLTAETPVAKKDTAQVKAVYNPNPRPVEPEKKKVVMINSDCARFASDNDVDKLRVKMLAENDVTKRVAIANKVFKTMCLYAKQMKALSELFATDETKYRFLEMAYPFAADTENFKQLYELFGAESYQAKFKTLVRY